ncbi:MAG TPA: IS1182 family transposase [Ktedonobacteraceae bacterium]|nr:IS1182 family transposase [Ktedonobacteraceae bacterium]
MSMNPQAMGEIPAETARIARAACPKGTLAMRLRDAMGEVYQDEQFVDLYPVEGQPAYAPWRLALVLVLQYTENLTDRQAVNAVRERLDWKYALGLELTDPGFDFSLLSGFRTRLIEHEAETRLLDQLLEVCKQHGWLKEGGKQRTDSTHVLARVRSLSNLECVGETLRAALDDLAGLVPEWLVQHVSADWFDRYSHRVENYRLPKSESQRTALATQIGADGLHLLAAVDQPDAPEAGKDLESVQVLRRVWKQYYEVVGGKAKWRAGPQAEEGEGVIRSPYDPQAQTGKKRETVWLGYKVHLTETCAPASPTPTPNLIVQVHTTVAPVPDGEMIAPIQAALVAAHLKPEEHLVDSGYVDGEHLAESHHQGIRLIGPTRPDTSWQAKADKGFDLAHFSIDWEKQQATCPQGRISARFGQAGERIEIVFGKETCATCPVRADCTRSQTSGRVLHARPRAAYEALHRQRQIEQTPPFRQTYALRAGIESTFSQGARVMGLRRSRYDGLIRTHVQQILTAVAINLVRIDAVLTHTVRGATRRSHFAQLASHPSLRPRVVA